MSRLQEVIDETLATERRETAKRILHRVADVADAPAKLTDRVAITWRELMAIVDEESK